MREDIRDYQRQLEAQRETMMTRRIEDQDYKDRMKTKNKDIAQAFEEIQVKIENVKIVLKAIQEI